MVRGRAEGDSQGLHDEAVGTELAMVLSIALARVRVVLSPRAQFQRSEKRMPEVATTDIDSYFRDTGKDPDEISNWRWEAA